MPKRNTCTIEGCGKIVNGRGLCPMHYRRARLAGSLPPRRTAEERFWARVDRDQDPDGCWTWLGARVTAGYGRFSIDGGVHIYAHRASYLFANGDLPDDMMVDHICHTPSCVRPDHLRLVTRKQNGEHRAGPTIGNTAGALGVSWSKRKSRWVAVVQHHGTKHRGGYYRTAEEAAEAARLLRLELFTHNDLDRTA